MKFLSLAFVGILFVLQAKANQEVAAPNVPQNSSQITTVQASNKFSPYCKNCISSSRKEYETCSEKNDYLQASLASLSNNQSSNFSAIQDGFFISEKEYTKTENCIRESMKSHGGPFRQCDKKEQGLAKERVVKACMNQNYVQTTTDSFIAVSDCFSGYLSSSESLESQDAVRRGLFSLISFESGFHTNAVSTTGSTGIGQFTTATLRGVNNMILENVLSYAKTSSKPSCKAIAKLDLNPYTTALKNRCELINPRDGNPLKNLIYVVGIQKLNRESLEKTLTVLPAKTQSAIENATPEFREKLINMIINWSHNTGIGGVRRPFINFVTSKRGLELIAKEDLSSFAKELAPMIGSYHANNLISCSENSDSSSSCERNKRARVSEVTRFYKGIIDRQGVINQNMSNAGGENKCGV